MFLSRFRPEFGVGPDENAEDAGPLWSAQGGSDEPCLRRFSCLLLIGRPVRGRLCGADTPLTRVE